MLFFIRMYATIYMYSIRSPDYYFIKSKNVLLIFLKEAGWLTKYPLVLPQTFRYDFNTSIQSSLIKGDQCSLKVATAIQSPYEKSLSFINNVTCGGGA